MALVKGTNAYAEVAEADAYFQDRFGGSAWSALDDTQKSQVLITATGLLDNLVWTGTALSEDQLLAFPRVGSYFEPRQGLEVLFDDGFPDRLTKGLFELCLHLSSNPDVLSDTGGVRSLTVGSINLDSILSPSLIPSSVRLVIKPLLANSGQGTWWRAN